MPRQALRVKLAPGVLGWARTTAGWTLDEAAQRLEVGPEEVGAWEEGTEAISLTKLQDLANYYKRPFAAFFLPSPPQTPPSPPDFRSLPGREGVFSKETLLALRRARRLQGIAAELMEALEQSARAVIGRARIGDNPEDVAIQERLRLEINLDRQFAWKDEREAFKNWRYIFENANILTCYRPCNSRDTKHYHAAQDLGSSG